MMDIIKIIEYFNESEKLRIDFKIDNYSIISYRVGDMIRIDIKKIQ